jgi:phytoene desaturase
MQEPKAIIIGAGVAGIACAIRLAVNGYNVTVYEKNSYPGGKLSLIKNGDYSFDAGPSLFTQPYLIEELFTLAKEPIENYFSYTALPLAFKYFFEDGTIVNAYTQQDKLVNELVQQLGEDSKTVIRYLEQGKKMYHKIGKVFLNHSLHQLKTLFTKDVLQALLSVKPGYITNSMHHYNNSTFKNKNTVQLFNRYATYNGSNPYSAPAMLSMIPYLELGEGTFYPQGGMISITNALYNLALKKGVKFNFNTTVTKIIEEQGKVKGVVAYNKTINAPIVISNMDAYFTYGKLLNNAVKANKILQQERSSSALIFYWGINKNYTELGLHNILFSENYQEEFDALFVTKSFYKDPTVYINITAKCEQGVHAPQGKENWFVMVNAPANVGQNWQQMQQQYRKAIVQKVNRLLHTNIEAFIETEDILDPVMIEDRTASYQGSLYGTSSNSKMAAFLRHPNFTGKIKGLYFVGGSVHPGGGIPLCLRSAAITAQIIANDYKITHAHI